jgi:hypothetical protein
VQPAKVPVLGKFQSIRKKVDKKGRQNGTFTPIRYVSVAVSCRPVPGFPHGTKAVRVCTYNGTSFAH